MLLVGAERRYVEGARKRVYKASACMLLVLAAVLQTLLLGECLLRRVLQIALPCRTTPVQRYANASLVSTLAAVGMNLATLPAQALARLLSGLSRYVLLGLCMATLFAVPSSVMYPFRVHTLACKSPLCVALLAVPLKPETAV